MATALTPTSLSTTGLTALGTPPAGDVAGNPCPNSGGRSFLYIENGGTARQLVVAFGRTVNGQAITSHTFTVPANFKGFYQLGSVADYGSIVSVTPNNAEVLLKLFQLA